MFQTQERGYQRAAAWLMVSSERVRVELAGFKTLITALIEYLNFHALWQRLTDLLHGVYSPTFLVFIV